MDYGWARLDSCSYRMHCNEKDTTGNILAVSNICSLYMYGSYNDCNSSAICGLSCSSWEGGDSQTQIVGVLWQGRLFPDFDVQSRGKTSGHGGSEEGFHESDK